VVGGRARLHPDEAWRQLLEERHDFSSPQPPSNDDLALAVNPMDLENVLCQI